MRAIGSNPLLVKLQLETPTPRPVAYAEPIVTIATVTQITYTESLYRDASTVSITTQITVGEYDYVHPTGSWGAFDTDNGAI